MHSVLQNLTYTLNHAGCTAPSFQPAVLVEGDLQPSYTHQDVITYGCKDGYRFDGASEQEVATITCDAGTWTAIRECIG